MIRTRIAPSPTGADIHIGNLYTALINWVWAKKSQGKFIIRIEDTDRTRLVKGAENKILQTLKEYGLIHDEGPDIGGPYQPYRQSERLSLYQHYADLLIKNKAAYYCICTQERLKKLRLQQQQDKKIPKYDKHCLTKQSEIKTQINQGKPHVIRLNVPDNRDIVFHDEIKGEIKVNSNNLDDQVLIKSDGYPTYHLGVVVDDYLMKISHIIRAEEWLSSTPKHILLYEAFGWTPPIFAHVPILRNPDRSKLSKRKNPVWASWYLEQGFLPEAVLNYLSLMGWSHPDQKEIFSLEEFVKVFTLKDIKSVGPAFDPVKLEWLNGECIRKSQIENLKTQILAYTKKYQKLDLAEKTVHQTIPLVQTRMKKLSDYWPLVKFIFVEPAEIEYSLNFLKQTVTVLLKEYEQANWQHQNIYQLTEKIAVDNQIKPIKLYMDLRFALANQKVTAPLFESMEIIGKNKVITRLKKAVNKF